jgi:hypothetical protein
VGFTVVLAIRIAQLAATQIFAASARPVFICLQISVRLARLVA